MRVFPSVLFAMFLCSTMAQEPQAPAPQQTATSVVSGVILNDVTKEPIRRVAVQLTLWPDSLSRLPPGTTPQSMPSVSTSTDAQGSFRFENLAPGAYNLTYYRQGYIGQRAHVGLMTPPGSDLIQVGRGQDTTNLRYTLTPQVVLVGRVVDEEGDPVQGTQVTVMMRRFNQGKRRWLPVGGVMTNDLGEFRMPSIPPGRVLLVVQTAAFTPMVGVAARPADGRPETAIVPTYYPSALTPGEATPIDVKAGAEVTNLQITLRRVEVYRIRGRAIGTDGKPLEAFYVTVHALGGEELTQPRQFVPKPNGEFEILSTMNGRYSLRLQVMQPGPHSRSFVSEQVDVSGGDVDGITLQANAGVTVSGLLMVEDADQKPQLAGNRITLVSIDRTMQNHMEGSEGTKEDGSFTLANVPPGRYVVHAFGPGVNGTYRARTVVAGVASRGGVIEVSGNNLTDVRVVLRKDSGSVAGTTEGIDAPDIDAGQARAVMLPTDPSMLETPDVAERIATISRGGEFEFTHVAPGEYRLWAIKNYEYSALLDEEIRQAMESKSVRVTVRPGETIRATAKLTEIPMD